MDKLADVVSLDPEDYDEVDIDDVDNPEWTAEDFARARPAREVLGDAFVDAWEAARLNGTLPARPVPGDAEPLAPALSVDVLDFYRAQGPDWQARLNADLEDLVRIKRRG